MKTIHMLPALLTAMFIAAPAADAGEITTSYTKNYGGTLLGGSVSVTAMAETEIDLDAQTITAFAEGAFKKKVKLLGTTIDALEMETWAVAQASDGELLHDEEFRVSVLEGIAVWSSESDGLTINLPTINVYPGSGPMIPVPCGPVTVKVKVNAGIDGAVSLSASAGTAPVRVRLTGLAQGWAQGSASASATFAGVVEVGVKAKLKLANLSANLNLSPKVTSGGLTGNVNILLKPIAIDLDAYAKIILPLLPDPKYTVNLIDWSAGQVSANYPLN